MTEGYYHLFKSALENETSVKLMNLFHGVPVTHEATIVEVTGGEIRVLTHPLQLICIRHQKTTYVRCQSLIYKAIALSTDMQREMVLLTGFQLNRNMGFRKSIRVEPTTPVKVCLCINKPNSNSNGLLTTMLDISIHGIAVSIKPFLFNISALEIGDKVCLKFNLSYSGGGIFKDIQVGGFLRNIVSVNDKIMRLGFEFLPDAVNERIIAHFVAQRQKDVLKELKKIYEEEFVIFK